MGKARRPKYTVVRRAIEERSRNGELNPGESLPSEEALAAGTWATGQVGSS